MTLLSLAHLTGWMAARWRRSTLLKDECCDLRGQRAVIVGRSDIVGEPLA
jgi:hypothetical protein